MYLSHTWFLIEILTHCSLSHLLLSSTILCFRHPDDRIRRCCDFILNIFPYLQSRSISRFLPLVFIYIYAFSFFFTWCGVACKIGKIQMSSNKVNFRIYFYKSIVDSLDRILSILLALYLQSRCEVQTLPLKATFFNSFLHTVSPQSAVQPVWD